MDPVTIKILNYDARIKEKNYGEVTSNFVHETSSTKFHPAGLYSEEIFGQIASPERLIRGGYITLHTSVFHPRVFDIIRALKGLYEEIIAGKTYAGFNPEINDFEKCSINDMETDPKDSPWREVGTGFSFFLKWWPKLNFKSTESIARNDKILLLHKYRNLLMVTKWIVLPAGLREYEEDAHGNGVSEAVNKLYNSLLNLSRAMPPTAGDSPVFDSIRYAIQKKIYDIHSFIIDTLDGKPGFVQRKYGYRKLAYATRNVITSPNMAAESPDSLQYHGLFESKIPLFQAAKAFQPLVIFNLKKTFFGVIFDNTSDNVGLIDPETHELKYHEIDETEKNRFTTSENLIDIINLYRNPKIRYKPVRAKDKEGKYFYLYLMYDTGSDIWFFRDLNSFRTSMEAHGKKFDPKYIRNFTYADMLYVATYLATKGKSCTITRYPAIEPESTYPSEVHLVSSKPGRIVQLRSTFDSASITLPEYPIIGARCVDSTILHPARLSGLDADFDGDQVSVNSVMSVEANQEFQDYYNSLGALVNLTGGLVVNINTDLIRWVTYNLTRDPSIA